MTIQGIVPGPQLITQHPDIFWGLIASFWIGNILLVLLNVPLIGVWVKLLAIPYRYLYPSALFFVCIGVYAANNDMFQVGEDAGDRRIRLRPAAPWFPSGADPARLRARSPLRGELPPRHADFARRLGVFVERPISAFFVALCVILIAAQIYFRLRGAKADLEPAAENAVSGEVPTELAAQRVQTTPAE